MSSTKQFSAVRVNASFFDETEQNYFEVAPNTYIKTI